MAHVELLYWSGCPSQPRALAELRAALIELGLDPGTAGVREICTADEAASDGFVGSPTVRVDGHDVQAPAAQPTGRACRVYRHRDGRLAPTPDPADLRDALRAAMSEAP